jgi:2-keto-4-pentenoate hydratase/2-oxohepta-3-ene-1,7-dioic acid hydratase in catechol pathway
MKLANFAIDGKQHVGALTEKGLVPFAGPASDVADVIRLGGDSARLRDMLRSSTQPAIDPATVSFLPPLVAPPKIICVGLNYADHTKESPYEQPDYPTLFLRVATSLIGDGAVLERPLCSDSLDFEGELAVVLGKGGRHIPKERALDCVFGYSVFNDGSVREYQFKSPQWTVGKNFDRTGAFGPYVVTADELPAGAKGLLLETRLNGKVVQSANTSDMIYDVASLISIISEAITLEAGDVIVAGTPSGIGWAREPKLMMRHGDVVEVSIEKVGVLTNPVRDEAATAADAGKR